MSDDSDFYDSDDLGGSEEGFMDDDDDDFVSKPSNGKGKQVDCTVKYACYSPEQLQALVDEDVRAVSAIIGASPPIVSILLRQSRWNRERLLERFSDSPSQVLSAAGEQDLPPAPGSQRPAASPVEQQPPNKRLKLSASFNAATQDVDCFICCDTVPAQDAFALRCAHAFCRPCWLAYVRSKVKDEGQCTFGCMQDGCKTVVDEESVKALVDPPTYERFRELVLASYVTSNPQLRFCPHPSCRQTVSCASASPSSLLSLVPTVRCGAILPNSPDSSQVDEDGLGNGSARFVGGDALEGGHAFCFGCGMTESHRPLVCHFAEEWTKNAREDAGTSQWIHANTRKCPKCQNSIEKSGGCNRMLCQHCKFQFCWMCKKNWDVHGYNDSVCSTWKEPEPDSNMSEAKRNLEKWLFYFDRFNNHELSAKLEGELYERAAEKIPAIQDASGGGLSWIEAQFMRRAVDELSRCRMTLKWSYAMAHFLATGNKKEMFEDVQADLEKAVEDLSQLLEEPIQAETIRDLRQKMVDKTAYVQKRHEIVLHDTATGLMEGTWEWTTNLE